MRRFSSDGSAWIDAVATTPQARLCGNAARTTAALLTLLYGGAVGMVGDLLGTTARTITEIE
ncbi:hypothetical protein [Haloplanus halobius]|uniref:hypothetical protein n=1 Tax=Haloplanus halobius TaxID=2934938 RepID=UPI00201015A9|nr:hypothetical protein [Haloplanus sp. XH21]